MNRFLIVSMMSAAVMAACVSASAHTAPESLGGQMKHIDIGLYGTQLQAVIDPSVPTPELIDQLAGTGHTYAGTFEPLNGTLYNAQYGWNLAAGFDNELVGAVQSTGATVWVRLDTQTEGLMTYLAPMGTIGNGGGGHTHMLTPTTLADAADPALTPLFETDGSSSDWAWPGRMIHPWYAVPAFMGGQSVFASYDLFLGDAQGNPLDGYQGTSVTLTWNAVPEPATALLALPAVMLLRRR